MRKILLALILGLLCLAFVGVGSVAALKIDFAVKTGNLIFFKGAPDNKLTFSVPDSQFKMISVIGGTDMDTINLLGTISGDYTVSTITQWGYSSDYYDTAAVTGSGTFTITDEASKAFTAHLSWNDIYVEGDSGWSHGGLNNLSGAVNITGKDYSGVNKDLIFLMNNPVTATLSFQFLNPGRSLTDLMANGADNSTSFSGTLNAVPLPSAMLLLAAGLVRVVGYIRKKTS